LQVAAYGERTTERMSIAAWIVCVFLIAECFRVPILNCVAGILPAIRGRDALDMVFKMGSGSQTQKDCVWGPWSLPILSLTTRSDCRFAIFMRVPISSYICETWYLQNGNPARLSVVGSGWSHRGPEFPKVVPLVV
jgi:hypothetical protein